MTTGFAKLCFEENFKDAYEIIKKDKDKKISYQDVFAQLCFNGNLNAIKFLLNKDFNLKININYFYEYRSYTCFSLACISGNEKIVNFLIDYGVDIHNNDEEPIYICCTEGHYKLVNLLLSKTDKFDLEEISEQIFNIICIEGYIKTLEIIFPHLIDINTDIIKNGIIHACTNGNLEIVKFLFKENEIEVDFDDNEAFLTSCRNNNIEIIKFLDSLSKEKGKPIDFTFKSNEALKIASINGDSDIINFLLSQNCHYDEKSQRQSFYFACCHYEIEVIKLFLKYNNKLSELKCFEILIGKIEDLQFLIWVEENGYYKIENILSKEIFNKVVEFYELKRKKSARF